MGVSPPSERKEKKKIPPQNKQKSDQTKKLANLVVTKNGEEWFWLEDTINNIFTNTHRHFLIILVYWSSEHEELAHGPGRVLHAPRGVFL